MNIKWGQKKLTFVIIPDAQSSVIRLRLPQFTIYAAAAAMILIALFALTMYAYQHRTETAKNKLASELTGKTEQFDRALTEKNEAIEQLQNDVIQLSQQAKEVKQKLENMKKLEDDLKSMASVGGSRKPEALAAAAGDAGPTGMGGTMYPVTPEEINRLSDDTKDAFYAMSDQIDRLQISLASVKQEVLQKRQKQNATPTLWPVSSHKISSGFGYRKDPFTSQPSFHSGLDISAKENSPVHVTAAGTVVSTGSDSSHGNNIIVDHSGGIRTWYMHLNKILVNKGDRVEKGQQIGLVGSTGRSTAPHLHYELLKNGQSVNPIPYLTEDGKDD